MRNFEKPGRSTVATRKGMAATSHPLATLAAVNVLQSGGNAIDAAIAACAVQCVVEPGSTGIGGDCFAMISPDGSDRIVAYNGSGRAPSGASASRCRQLGLTAIPRQSPEAVTVPGAVEAWARLIGDYGTRSLGELLRPAVELAREGYAISPRVAYDWAQQESLLRAEPNAAHIFLSDGLAPRERALHRQPELAQTLEKIGEEGPDAFYKGSIAEGIVQYLQARGGVHTLQDFAATQGAYETPIRVAFREHDVFECPPNGQGVIALMILNILSGFSEFSDPLSADRLHLEIEATRLAYSVRDAVLADPAQAEVPVAQLLSMEFAAELRSRIDPKRAMGEIPSFAPPDHQDTVYICVVDKDRMAVSFINSLFSAFGSGLVDPASGVLLHNRGQSFTLDDRHPNALASRKRPLHTIIPGMVAQGGRVRMPFGVMGGHYQAMGHAHLLSKIFDYGLDLQSAMDLPRVFPKPGSGDVEAEGSLPNSTWKELERRGFRLAAPERAIGGAQAIWIDWDRGTLCGASDHRKDGCALGY